MITGDNQSTADKVAEYLSIPREYVVAEAYPSDKKEAVKKWQSIEKRHVMFIGDGINDSPVLAQADVGVSINSANSLTVDAAGIVLIKDDLKDVLNALRISRMAFKRIKINLGLSFFYNIILIPVAMGIFYPAGFTLNPMYAGIAMALSSVSVMMSSLLLKTYRPLDLEKSLQN